MNNNPQQHSFEQISVTLSQNGNLIASYTISQSNFQNFIQTFESRILTTFINNQEIIQKEKPEISSDIGYFFRRLTNYQLHYQDIIQNQEFAIRKNEAKIQNLNKEIQRLNQIIREKDYQLQQNLSNINIQKNN